MREATDLGTMTNRQIVDEHERLLQRELEIAHKMIADGYGHLRPSDMRADPDVHALAAENLASLDRRAALMVEAKLRYGPDLLLVDWLGKTGYRRVRLKTAPPSTSRP